MIPLMPQIPDLINTVQVGFDPGVDRDVVQLLIDGLVHTVFPDVADGFRISHIWVSSARDRHSCPSRHVTGNAVDISRINGKRIGLHYDDDIEVRTTVDALQKRFESYLPYRRENFGPFINLKEGKPHTPPEKHNDHIHFSVSGPHDCSGGLWPSLLHLLKRKGKEPEVCRFS